MAPTAKSESSSSSSTRKRSGSGSNPVPSKKSATKPVIIDYGQLEEKQAKERSAESDTQVFKSTMVKMKEILGKVQEIKLSGSRKSNPQLNDLKVDFLMHLMTLKKLNRLEKLRTKHSRESTGEAKAKVDNFHLQLQNLLYEVLHLQKEVTKCLQYKSADADFDLVSVEDFYANAPEAIQDRDKTETNEHLQRLARLQYENLQRREQFEECSTLEAQKQALESHIRKKSENLANLKPQLKTILNSAVPVQKFLQMPLIEENDQLELAKYLPRPLFILYNEVRAYGQACDPDVQVQVLGNLEEAKAEFEANRQKRLATTGDAAQDEEQEATEDIDDDDSKKKKKSSAKSGQGEKLKKLLTTHPLQIEFKVKLQQCENFVQVTFLYLTELQVVTVKTKLILDQDAKSLSGDREVMQAHSILSHLLSVDEGSQCPNPAFSYILKRSGLTSTPNIVNLGSMYNWAQNLAGIKFPTEAQIMDENIDIDTDPTICQTIVEKTIDAIKQRLVSRIGLQRAISQLEKSKLISVDLDIPESLKNQFPSKVSSTIRAWAPVNWEQYVALDVTKHLVDSGAVDEHDFLFRLQINRDSAASLIALIGKFFGLHNCVQHII